MQHLRLLADDLTGALDTSAELVGAFGPLEVTWTAAAAAARTRQGSFAIDSGSRELTAEQAFAITQELAPLLRDVAVAYKKIDSLLRGPWAAELEACLRTGFWDACIVAPAFAYQGRRTSGGRQYAMAPDGSWRAVGDDIVAQLGRRRVEARLGRVEEGLKSGVTVFDAETEEDIDRIAQLGRNFSGRLLWCGSGGLAGALARGGEVRAPRKLRVPVLGVFGSDHPVTEAQLAMCADVVVAGTDGRIDPDQVRRRLTRGAAFVRLGAREPSSRADAASHFAQEIARLSQAIDPPGTLIAAGGETLKAQCLAVGADALKVLGRLDPGVPKSVIQGGGWAGTDVISKSGAFGPPKLWRNLLDENGLL
jgi:D-threonate/D-erythronate kinase